MVFYVMYMYIYVIIHDLFFLHTYIISIAMQVYNYTYTCKYNIYRKYMCSTVFCLNKYTCPWQVREISNAQSPARPGAHKVPSATELWRFLWAENVTSPNMMRLRIWETSPVFLKVAGKSPEKYPGFLKEGKLRGEFPCPWKRLR